MTLRTRTLIAGATVALALGMLSQTDAGGFLLKKEDIPKTIAQLRSGTPQQKAAAAAALGERGAVRASDVKEAVEPLKTVFLKETDPKARAAAARALGQIAAEPKETAQLLLKSLKSDKEDDQVRMAAMVAIGSLGPAGRVALPELRKIAKDKDEKKLSKTAKMVLKSMQKK